jgi:hypothetical protein
VVGRAERLGGVLDDGHVMAGRDVEHSVEVTRHVLEVHGDDRGRAVGDVGRQVGAIEPEGVVHLREHRDRPGGDDRVHGRDERERGHDDLVATSHAHRCERAPKRGGSIRDCHRVSTAERVARRPFEVGHGAPHPLALVTEQRAAGDDRGDRVCFGLPEQRGALREVERLDPHRRPAVEGEHGIVSEHPGIVPTAVAAVARSDAITEDDGRRRYGVLANQGGIV